jgi:phosphatidylserine decarboxylase
MCFGFDSRIKTNAKATQISKYEYENLHFKKGDELGYFELGSTVVVLFPQDFEQLLDLSGKKVKFGEGLSIV